MRSAQKPEVECIGKEPIKNATLARRIASMASSRREARMEAYRCGVCGMWHVGSKVGKKKNQVKRSRLYFIDNGDDFHDTWK